MFVIRRLPAFFSLLMLSALTLRLGTPFFMAIPLALVMIMALFIPKTSLQKILSVVLMGGTLIWPCVGFMRASERLNFGQPWIRLAAIFTAVTLFTAWSAWTLWTMENKERN